MCRQCLSINPSEQVPIAHVGFGFQEQCRVEVAREPRTVADQDLLEGGCLLAVLPVSRLGPGFDGNERIHTRPGTQWVFTCSVCAGA